MSWSSKKFRVLFVLFENILFPNPQNIPAAKKNQTNQFRVLSPESLSIKKAILLFQTPETMVKMGQKGGNMKFLEF